MRFFDGEPSVSSTTRGLTHLIIIIKLIAVCIPKVQQTFGILRMLSFDRNRNFYLKYSVEIELNGSKAK